MGSVKESVILVSRGVTVFRVPGVGEAVAMRGGTASAVVNERVSGLERVVE